MTAKEFMALAKIFEKYEYNESFSVDNFVLSYINGNPCRNDLEHQIFQLSFDKNHGTILPDLVRLDEEEEIKQKRLQLLKDSVDKSLEAKKKEKEAQNLRYISGKYTQSSLADALDTERHQLERESYDLLNQALQVPWPISFEEAGRAIRALLPILGKPNYERAVDFTFKTKPVGWKAKSIEQLVQSAMILVSLNMRNYEIDSDMRLILNIPEKIYLSSYYKSDNPADWQEKNEEKNDKMTDLKQIRAVQKKLDGVK